MKQICDKEGFKRHADGVGRLKHLNQSDRHKYKLYQCKHCGLWHIATITKRNLVPMKKVEKYPMKVNEMNAGAKRKEHFKPFVRPVRRQPPVYATQKLLTKQQADILKHIIEYRQTNEKPV